MSKEGKTIFDYIKEDSEALKQVQTLMDIQIGHNLVNKELSVYYRNHKFIIKMTSEGIA